MESEMEKGGEVIPWQSFSKDGGFELQVYWGLNGVEESFVISSQQFVVNVDRNNDNCVASYKSEDRVVSMCSAESKLYQEVM